MTKNIKYQVSNTMKVLRTSNYADYRSAATDLIEKLNDKKGVFLSSSFEYPGRYTRWDVGFVNPPLMIISKARRMSISALNERGVLLLAAIYKTLEGCEAIKSSVYSTKNIALEINQAEEIIFEEERSRKFSIFSVLREIIYYFQYKDEKYLGLYGAFGYELAFQFEEVESKLTRSDESRDLVLYLPDEILVVDHQKEKAVLHSYEFEFTCEGARKESEGLPREGSIEPFEFVHAEERSSSSGDHNKGEYAKTVSKAREYFSRGDLFEVVPGQLFFEECIDLPSDIFLRLQKNNPAPYGALMNLGEQEYIVAASPEMYVRVKGERVETCPISGTIARGEDAIEDAENIKTLLNSLKEESELSMCTDVDRNDKSRVCEAGTVNVIGRRQIELYSRLMHTVDHVEGKLKKGLDALDAFLTHAWAVTVTGAPKKAAMQFIEDHEKSPRHWYGGAMGFLGFNGDLNTGLTLRTMRIQNGVAQVRAGATLLYDSDPNLEEVESRLKASALLSAIKNDYSVASEPKHVNQTRHNRRNLSVLLIDFQDSFVHTLASYFEAQHCDVKTVRVNNIEQALSIVKPDLIVLSPGPGKPQDFKMNEVINICLKRNVSLFGVCLGLQGIVEYFGGKLSQLNYPMHGKPSQIKVSQGKLFNSLPSRFKVGRYHSLVASRLPECLRITARTVEDNVVMAVEHKTLPITAVQFHPESILSLNKQAGKAVIANVLATVIDQRQKDK